MSRILKAAVGLGLAVSLTFAALAQNADHPQNAPLRVAADVGFAPFAFKKPTGETTGFSYEFAQEIARRMGRPGVEMVDANFSAIFAGLFSKRFELIVAPTNVTTERAAQMLFTEPYMPTGLGFLTKKGVAIGSLEDLRGKAVAVNSGSVADKWATENEQRYGFTLQRYNKNADAVQAVMIGRAFVNVADAPVSRYIATQTPMAEVPFTLDLGRNFALAARKDDVAFRNEVEMAIECMKRDGTLSQLHAKWFGVAPAADSSTATVFPGFGAPGFEGHDTAEHQPACR
ncbi:MAG: substrate-binding periplasmic protein [Phreatobacter sp.]